MLLTREKRLGPGRIPVARLLGGLGKALVAIAMTAAAQALADAAAKRVSRADEPR